MCTYVGSMCVSMRIVCVYVCGGSVIFFFICRCSCVLSMQRLSGFNVTGAMFVDEQEPCFHYPNYTNDLLLLLLLLH